MIGSSVQRLYMDVGAGSAGKTLEEVICQLRLKVADEARAYFGIDHGHGAPAEIDCGKPQCLIHSHKKVSGTQNAFAVAKRTVEGFSQRDSNVFNAVMLIHIEIAVAFEPQIEATVASEELEHVIEEVNPGGDLVFSPAIDLERQGDISLVGLATELGGSH